MSTSRTLLSRKHVKVHISKNEMAAFKALQLLLRSLHKVRKGVV